MHAPLDLTGLAYRAAAEPALWEDVAERLRQNFDARVAIIMARGDGFWDIRFVVHAGLSKPEWDDYVERWGPRDPHLPVAMQLATGEAMLSHEVLDLAAFKATSFYRELYSRWGLLWCAAGMIERSEDVFAALAVHREADKPPFGPEDRARLEALLPHVRHALRLQGTLGRLHQERSLWRQLVEQLDLPVLLMTRDGELLDANPAGARALAAGQLLQRVRNRVVATDPALTRRLTSALLQEIPHQALEIKGMDGGLCQLTILHSESAMATQASTRLLVLGTPRSGGLGLKKALGLSPMELKVAEQLAYGSTPRQIARAMGISYETVRSHLKRAMAKTNTRRQAELVARVLRGGHEQG